MDSLQHERRCHDVLRACLRTFVDKWTSLSILDVSQRLQALSLLQPLTEMQVSQWLYAALLQNILSASGLFEAL